MLRVGHGLEEGVTMGALTVPQGLDKVARQVEDARNHGADVLTGGNRMKLNDGFFFEPTIIGNASHKMLVASEETFGPLLALFPFDTEEAAVKAANNTSVSITLISFQLNTLLPFFFFVFSIPRAYAARRNEMSAGEMSEELMTTPLADGPRIVLLYQKRRSHLAPF